MAPTKVKAAAKVPTKSRKPVQPVFDNSESESSRAYADEVLEKDETEQKLEKLIFGDEVGFLDSLRSRETGNELLRRSSSDEIPSHHEDDQELEDVADEDVLQSPILARWEHSTNSVF